MIIAGAFLPYSSKNVAVLIQISQLTDQRDETLPEFIVPWYCSRLQNRTIWHVQWNNCNLLNIWLSFNNKNVVGKYLHISFLISCHKLQWEWWVEWVLSFMTKTFIVQRFDMWLIHIAYMYYITATSSMRGSAQLYHHAHHIWQPPREILSNGNCCQCKIISIQHTNIIVKNLTLYSL